MYLQVIRLLFVFNAKGSHCRGCLILTLLLQLVGDLIIKLFQRLTKNLWFR